MDQLTRLPISADPTFIPLRLGDRLTPEQFKILFPKAPAVIQQIAVRVTEARATTVERAS